MKLELTKRELIYPLGSVPFPSVHASTLVFLDDERIAAAWFGGANESNPDVRIWFSVLSQGVWSFPVAITPDNGIAHWNPTLFNDNGRLVMIYKEGLDPRKWYSMIIESTDDGQTWTEPRELVPGDVGGRGPVKDKMIRLSNGELLAPASIEDERRRWVPFADLSNDGGKTWTRSAPIPILYGDTVYNTIDDMPDKTYGLIQPTAWEEDGVPGRIHMLMRSSLGYIYHTVSNDFGRTWSVAKPTVLPNNNSGIDCVKTESGAIVLIYNPVGDNWGSRSPVSLTFSTDNGESWSEPLHVETLKGEFSYPAIIARGNKLYMTYTHRREGIAYAEAELVD